jgi:hypothetical protein
MSSATSKNTACSRRPSGAPGAMNSGANAA